MITNNCHLFDETTVIRKETTEEVLQAARDLVHAGHMLLNHPKYGNLTQKNWFYRTLLVSEEKKGLDVLSLELIEDAVLEYQQGKAMKSNVSDQQLHDFRIVDADIIIQAVELLPVEKSIFHCRKREGR